ncbi:hypothetical protein [Microbacterium album]|uniref:Uncharacterized protein n=1 Tax=Microbacterium album TaxID=2053191 RepID=A0A917MM66_9MICO|nr:hypothetical protein [Microbacterium album]GGH42651.1 hypothetical protein GCM10010921_16000 [Microbacterium album]
MSDQTPRRRGRAADPTRMRNQPALATPKRWIWIVPSILLAAAAIVAFVASMPINLALAWIGIAFVVASLLAILVTAFAVREDRARNFTLAALMLIMAVAALALLLGILWAAQLPQA